MSRLCIFTCFVFANFYLQLNAQVEIKNTIPDYFVRNSPINVNITISKTEFVTDFAKYQLQLPLGYNVSAVEIKEGKFAFFNHVAKIVWIQIPSDTSFTFTLKIEATEACANTGKFIERFIYIESKERQENKLKIKQVTVVDENTEFKKESVQVPLLKNELAKTNKALVLKDTIPLTSTKKDESQINNRYCLQLGAFKTKPSTSEFKHIGIIDIENINGVYKVFCGQFKSRNEAQTEQNKLKQKGIDCFVVEIKK